MADVDRSALEKLVRQVLLEKLGGTPAAEHPAAHGVRCVAVPRLEVREQDRLDTGRSGDRVWTRDLFTLEQSPRLGAGLMVMEHTTFPWHLAYDEIDYVISGRLTVISPAGPVTAGPGQVILIPKDSDIQFSAPESARFLYVTYPADWQNQP